MARSSAVTATLGFLLFFSPLSVGATKYTAVCETIAKQISGASEVFYPLSLTYAADLYHWMTSSEQDAACIVEVGNNADVATVMKIIGQTKTPFAIKSGGHSSNPGFSSTKGVQIEMARFNEVKLSSDNSSVTVGMGNIWTDVYTALQGTGYNVNGGRVSGPGTGGFSLGGGYSWLVNSQGLTVDTFKSLTLVLPNGTITQVDQSTPDLFFALKGGLNKFGVVTDITYKAIPQTNVFGGIRVYSTSETEKVLNATLEFYNTNTDPKSQIITTIEGTGSGSYGLVLFFHNAPRRSTAFKPFDNITATIDLTKSQTFGSFSQSTPSELEAGSRGAFATLMSTKLTSGFLDAIRNESLHYGALAAAHGGKFVSYDIEPFAGDYGKHATDSAFPHSKSPLPLNLYFSWSSRSEDTYWRTQMKASIARLTAVAKAEGIFDPEQAVYPNYALADTPVEQLYGTTNLARLRQIRAQIDPDNVMSLAGGFNI